jgi:homoserine kinase
VSADAQIVPGSTSRVRVPATSANLGPAFDAAGVALTLYDDVEVDVTDGGCRVEVTGEGAGTVPVDESHLVVRALRAGLEHAGVAQPGLTLRAVNRIPHGRGLGSSAAATVAGLMAARDLLAAVPGRELDDATLLSLATRFEGHADNVGAALKGGLTLVWEAEGTVAAHRLVVHPDVEAVVLVPDETLSTSRARGLLPASVPHRAAAFNAGRSALLVTALCTRPDLLLPATEDRLHQPYRAGAFPESMTLLARLRRDGNAAVISGAGPSVLVLGTASALERVDPGEAWRMNRLHIDHDGAHVLGGTRVPAGPPQ